MSKKRLLSGAVLVAVLAAASVLATVTASAKPAKQHDTVKLGFITKFPVDFYFTLVNAAKKWDKATPGASVSSTPAARAAPTTPARSPRSRTWSPRA